MIGKLESVLFLVLSTIPNVFCGPNCNFTVRVVNRPARASQQQQMLHSDLTLISYSIFLPIDKSCMQSQS